MTKVKCEFCVQNSRLARIGARTKLPGQMGGLAHDLFWALSQMLPKHRRYIKALRVLGGAGRARQAEVEKRGVELQVGEIEQSNGRQGRGSRARQDSRQGNMSPRRGRKLKG